MPNDDPWDWTVDRIVQELCTSSRSWTPRSASAPTPDFTILEAALRREGISGDILLVDVDDAFLRNDLDMAAKAWRTFILHAVKVLRARSPQYTSYLAQDEVPKAMSTTEEAIVRGIQGGLQGFMEYQARSAQGSVFGGSRTSPDEPSSKRLKLGDIDQNGDNVVATGMLPIEDQPLIDEAHSSLEGKKRKRIAPTLITSEVDPHRNREILTAADDLFGFSVEPEPQPEAEPQLQPGVIFVDKDGKKRMVPILQQSEPVLEELRTYDDSYKQSGEVAEQSRTLKPTPRAHVTRYLGKKALLVDKLFYEGVAIGEQVDISDDVTEFCRVPQDLPTGQRKYVGNMMKRFLRCEWKSFTRGGESFLAVRPYTKLLVPQLQKPSFTLYYLEDGQTFARRENDTDWHELEAATNKKQLNDERSATFNPLGPDVVLGTSYDEWNPSSLEKYKNLEGGDELLPLYGDSDSDNEYDLQTWNEIEKEKGAELKCPLRKSNRPAITPDEISEAIEEGIAQLVAKWTSKELPKLKKKAWRLWMKSRKRGTKYEQIVAAQDELEHISDRLGKLRNKMLEQSYTSKVRVHKQTISMEGTVFDREELLWKISTLKEKRPPEKYISAPRQPVLQLENDQGLEGENLESQNEQDSSEDGLDDFIAEDEEEDDIMVDEDAQEVPFNSEDEDVPVSDRHTAKSARKRSLSSETLSVNGDIPSVKKEVALAAKPKPASGPNYIDMTWTSSDEKTPIKINKEVIDLDTPPPNRPNFTSKVQGTRLSSVVVSDDEDDQPIREQLNNDPFFGKSYGRVTKEDDDDSEDDEPLSAPRRIPRTTLNSGDLEEELSDDENETFEEENPRKKKKFVEDVQAREKRERVQRNKAEQDARRQELHSKLASQGDGDNEENGQIIINDAAKEGYYYLNEHLAQRVKKHQIAGIRFLWASTITESKELEGCLLAHTMGLGKTMQAISLLVSIAEASASDDPLLSSQIPDRLRESKTLVLCPPGLIANWWDELLTWVRPDDLLGELSKVDASIPLEERLQRISDWHANGGVLILGYEMFRNMVQNVATDKRERPLSEEQHTRILEELVKGPNIVIADEAHKMKNANAGLTQATLKFDTKCRIALTGSPLANNIAEYHTMIEWISPNYLGPAKEFRAKFVEPIQAGLYSDSTAQERSKSRTMLRVLEKDIDPKVQRADMSVLKHDMPPKTEFTITVALTDLQKQAYSEYVTWSENGALTKLTKDGQIQQSTLWKYLGILTLLCNHPSLFKAKLAETPKKSKPTVSREITDAEETPGLDIVEVDETWDLIAPKELVDRQAELFDIAQDIEALDLSNKVKVLFQILDAAQEAGDKTLVFSQSIPTLDYIERILKEQGRLYARLDGRTKMEDRQKMTKKFNDEKNPTNIFIISTTAGGLGLNLPGANRVVIFDFKFNPIQEEQAIGRAYRIGQRKETFVYRLIAGGTFESIVYNTTVFKQQLASRVVDKKAQKAAAMKKVSEYLFQPEDVPQKDLSELFGMDAQVLDKILASQTQESTIRAIVQSDNFEREDEGLTPEEEILVAAIQEAKRKGKYGPDLYASTVPKNHHRTQPIQEFQAYDAVIIPPQPRLGFSITGAVKQSTPSQAVYLPPPPPKIAGEGSVGPSTPAVIGRVTPIHTPRHTPISSPVPGNSQKPGSVRSEKRSANSSSVLSGQSRSNSITTNTVPRSPILPVAPATASSQNRGIRSDIAPEEPAIVKTDLYKAMNRRPTPVASLRTPVVKKHKRHTSSTGSANGGHERDQNRRKSGVNSSSTPAKEQKNPPAKPPALVPSWARRNIEGARQKTDRKKPTNNPSRR